MNIKTDLFNEVQIPVIILSTRWHKHLGAIENIDKSTISFGDKLNSADEFSFDVYKKLDDRECTLWNSIIDFKLIYVPDKKQYYEIQVSIDEDDKIVKHITATAACEAELDQRMLRDFECNTESDISRDDYDPNYPTVFYRSDPEHQDASLLHRVLHDKCQDYSIIHVDSSLANIQRTFSTSSEGIYSFLNKTISEEIGCLFIFDSINRGISAYDLKCNCLDCGNRDEWENECPECGSLNCTYGYGKFTQVFVSPENFAQSLSIEGDADGVKNCFKVEGGDDLINSTIININPNGSQYLYRFSDFMLNDMPDELKEKIISYNELYDSKYSEYMSNAENLYNAIDEEMNLIHKMMPEITIPVTTASEEYLKAENWLVSNAVAVNNKNIKSLSDKSADLAVKGMATALVNANYDVEIIESDITIFDDVTKKWNGRIRVKNVAKEDDVFDGTNKFQVLISNENYDNFVHQKIQKAMDRQDYAFDEIYNIEDIEEFKDELTKYCLNSLTGFKSSYDSCIEILIEQGVEKDNPLYGVDLYTEIYEPYNERLQLIDAEIKVREEDIKSVQSREETYISLRDGIQKELDFKTYIGDDLWKVFNSYLREDTYTNSNYISDGCDNAELIKKANELMEVAKQEIYKSSELQLTLSSSLNDLLLHEEFKKFKDYIQLGNWIVCKVDEELYRLRITDLSFDYGSPENISITFSNVTRYRDYVSDIEDLLNKAGSVTSSFNYVAHQAENGDNVANSYSRWIEDGLDSALIMIKNNDKEEITYDEHGIIARTWDDILGDYSGEQLKITHNCIAFTEDSWKTASSALGKHQYTKYDSASDSFKKDIDYGLTAKFVQAGYIYGSTLVSGQIYSQNYSRSGKIGSMINLENGNFSLGNGKLTWDGTDMNYTGNFTMTGGDLTVKNKNGQQLFKADVSGGTVNIAGFTVKNNAIYNGTTSVSDWNNAGIYIGTDGICCASTDSTKGVQIKNGILSAWGANITNATIDTASIPNLSAAKITSGSITVSADDAGTLFQADLTNKRVYLAGFTVASVKDSGGSIIGRIRYGTKNISDWYTAGIYIGTDGILLTNGKKDDEHRSVQISDGYLRCWGAQINEATIDTASIPSLDASKITSGEIDADKITVKNIDGKNIKAGTITASEIKAHTITASEFKSTTKGSMDLGSAAYTDTMHTTSLQIDGSTFSITSSGMYYTTSGGVRLHKTFEQLFS